MSDAGTVAQRQRDGMLATLATVCEIRPSGGGWTIVLEGSGAETHAATLDDALDLWAESLHTRTKHELLDAQQRVLQPAAMLAMWAPHSPACAPPKACRCGLLALREALGELEQA